MIKTNSLLLQTCKIRTLSEKKLIAKVFNEGKFFYSGSFKVLYIPAVFESQHPVKIMVSVSRRNFKKAVDRNLIKRRIREAYRKNKNLLYAAISPGDQIAVAVIYTSKEILPYSEIQSKIILILRRLVKEYEKSIG